jgi:hypothetical protein
VSDPRHPLRCNVANLSLLYEAEAVVREKKQAHEAASSQLELAHIRKRARELASQHEPLNSLTAGDRDEQERILKAVFYAVFGNPIAVRKIIEGN